MSPSEKCTLVRKFIGWGLKRDFCLSVAGLSRHTYYYQAKGRQNAGIKASEFTLWYDPYTSLYKTINNSVVVEEIIRTLLNPDTFYGYKAMTAHLQLRGYKINHKKVYRLMDRYDLLQEFRKKSPKVFVKYRRVRTNGPLEVLEMDIKLQWITSLEKYAYILTVIDCFTRKVLNWKVGLSIKKEQVKAIWEEIIVDYLQENDMLSKGIKIEVRNDNDKRFEAKMVKEFFEENHLNQVFTHPYTPQENGHIESFHSIISRSLDTKYYSTLDELEQKLKSFYINYNQIRVHGSLDHLPPDIFWALWNQGQIEKKEQKGKITKFKIKLQRYQLTGNASLRELPVPVCA